MIQKVIVISLVSISAATWILSGVQQDRMMSSMSSGGIGSLNVTAITLFTALWTAGMGAMMFPAISPMVLLYNRLISGKGNNNNPTITVPVQKDNIKSGTTYYPKTILFVGCYLVVWTLTGIALFIGWSLVMNVATVIYPSLAKQNLTIVYGAIIIISGSYQFSPLKSTCLGYCESPLSFFMRRWKDGTAGAVKMGLQHGIYCLGCCWPYFLLMVALGWMNLLWMGLFAGIIFAEKIWKKGVWVARAAGIGLVTAGILILAGYVSTSSIGIGNSVDMSNTMSSNAATGKMQISHGTNETTMTSMK